MFRSMFNKRETGTIIFFIRLEYNQLPGMAINGKSLLLEIHLIIVFF